MEDGVDPVRAGSMEFLSGVTELNHVGYCTATDPSTRHRRTCRLPHILIPSCI